MKSNLRSFSWLAAAVCLAGAASAQLLIEDFEGEFPGTYWTVRDDDPQYGEYTWTQVVCSACSGTSQVWSGGVIECQGTNGYQDAFLSIDCRYSGYSGIGTDHFYFRLTYPPGGDSLSVHFEGWFSCPQEAEPPWASRGAPLFNTFSPCEMQDIALGSSFDNMGFVRITFRYRLPTSGFAPGAYLDDIEFGTRYETRLEPIAGGFSGHCPTPVPLDNGLTYQGRLDEGGDPFNGLADLRFSLWDAAGTGMPPAGGMRIGGQQLLTDVPVTNGLFTVFLNGSGEFGAEAFNGEARWLQAEVCADDSCASSTVLGPRQPIGVAPYALKALSPDGHSLDAADDSPADALYVNEVGNVGIGTTAPGKNLTVDGDVEIGTAHGDYRHLRIGGGNSSGFLYGSYPRLLDGIHLGYNYYATASGTNIVIHPDGGTSRISAGYGALWIATQSPFGGEPLDRLVVTRHGDVGIGTNDPTTRLDVRGNIRLGPAGQYFAVSAQESLRIVRGVVSNAGGIIVGAGFVPSRTGTGQYTITFVPAFPSPPAITATADEGSQGAFITTEGVTASYASLRIRWVAGSATGTSIDTELGDRTFHFIAMGPR